MSFVAADAVYELGLKSLLEKSFSFMQAPPAPISMGVGLGELQDGVLKSIPIILVQQIICKLMYKKSYKHRFMRNCIHRRLYGCQHGTAEPPAHLAEDAC